MSEHNQSVSSEQANVVALRSPITEAQGSIWPPKHQKKINIGGLNIAYTDEGELVDRGEVGAVHGSTSEMLEQVIQIARDGRVTTVSGNTVPLRADTICVHGDNEAAVEAAKEIYQALKS